MHTILSFSINSNPTIKFYEEILQRIFGGNNPRVVVCGHGPRADQHFWQDYGRCEW